MARMIDAVQVLHNINMHHRPTPVSEFESGFNYGLNQAMWEITHAPTLSPPNEPLTLDELRKMDGEPVWWDDGDWSCWGIVTVDTDGFWAGIPFLRGRRNRTNFEYNIKLNRMKIYRRPPEGEEETP